MNSELTKLQSISANVRDIQSRIEERLPHTRQQLLALITIFKWRIHARSSSLDIEPMKKKISMEIHSYDYRVREQAELLERHLCELDNILSNGNTEVKEARKALVLHIQTLLQNADALKSASSKLMHFSERILAAIPHQTESAMNAAQSKDDIEVQDADEVMEEGIQQSIEGEEIDLKERAEAKHDSDSDTEDADDEMESEAENQREVDELMVSDEIQRPEGEEDVQEDADEVSADCNDQASVLPLWTPYYHVERRGDGIYLIAKLHGVDSNNLHISVHGQSGLITISGVKYPSQKDLILSQWTGSPTFGRFKLLQRVDPRIVNLEEATQRHAPDGTLVIRLPFYYLHHPRIFERAMYAPRRHCAVW